MTCAILTKLWVFELVLLGKTKILGWKPKKKSRRVVLSGTFLSKDGFWPLVEIEIKEKRGQNIQFVNNPTDLCILKAKTHSKTFMKSWNTAKNRIIHRILVTDIGIPVESFKIFFQSWEMSRNNCQIASGVRKMDSPYNFTSI